MERNAKKQAGPNLSVSIYGFSSKDYETSQTVSLFKFLPAFELGFNFDLT